MAYNDSAYPNRNAGPRDYRGQPPKGPRNNPAPLPPEVKPLPLPENYVDVAETVIRTHAEERSRITTSKIRNLYSLLADIYNVENLRDAPKLLPASVTALTMLRIRAVYEAGRESSVRTFLDKSKLLAYLKDIGADRQKLLDFTHYMEALVAYHRLYIGGREG